MPSAVTSQPLIAVGYIEGSTGFITIVHDIELPPAGGYHRKRRQLVQKCRVLYSEERRTVLAPNALECLQREATIYDRVGRHANIIGYCGMHLLSDGEPSIRLEYAEQGTVRGYILSHAQKDASIELRTRWILGAASALTHLHRHNITHCDISCRNFLVAQGILKMADFGAASIDGDEPTGGEEVRYDLPKRGRKWNDRPTIKRDIFALGMAIYEIMLWQMPFADLTDGEIERSYANHIFPDVKALPYGGIVTKCWREEYDCAQDVLAALNSETPT